MLRALLHGKDLGAHIIGVDTKISWRQIFKASEDFLTAAVFSRLSYLNGADLWSILREAFGNSLPNYKVATLKNIEFWPRWSLSTRDFVEPDIFLQFSLGDPEVLVDILIEAKLGEGLGQYSAQWIAEIEAYREQFPINVRDNFYFLAIGGLGANFNQRVNDLATQTSGVVGETHIAGTSWSKLTDVVHARTQKLTIHSRIVDDILEALALCGERHIVSLGSLESANRNWSLEQIKILRAV